MNLKKENALCRHGGNPTDKQYEKPNLEQGKLSKTNPSKIPMTSERVINS